MMMKKLFVTRDLTSFVNRGAKVIPQMTQAAPVTLSLVLGAAVIWVVARDRDGHARRRLPRHARSTRFVMVLGLVGISMPVFWVGEVVNLLTQSRLHDTFLFSWVPPLGYVPLTQSPVGLVQGADPPVAHARDPLHRHLRARAALEPDRGAGAGLRPHRAREGADRAARAGAPRAAHLAHHLRQPLRPRLRRARRRRRAADRGRVRPARASASSPTTRCRTSTCR